MDNKKFPAFLISLRKKFALTQDFIAKKLELSRPTYNKIEQGKADLNLPQAEILANYYNIPLDNFVKCENNSFSNLKIKLATTPNIEIKDSKIKWIEKKIEAIKYLWTNYAGIPSLNERSINWLLFVIEAEFIGSYNKPILGFNFIKTVNGPMAVGYGNIIENLIKGNLAAYIIMKPYIYPKRKILILEPLQIEKLKIEEIEFINLSVNKFKYIKEEYLQDSLEKYDQLRITELNKLIEI